MPDESCENSKLNFLFSENNQLYLEFKKILQEMLCALAVPCALDEDYADKIKSRVALELFSKLKIKELILAIPKEVVLKTCQSLREILNCLGYYEKKSELSKDIFLKKCQTIIDFFSAVYMHNYEVPLDDDLAIKEDDPFAPRLYVLIENYFSALSNLLEVITEILSEHFCEIKDLSQRDFSFIETQLVKAVHPILDDAIDNLTANQAEFLISVLGEMANSTGCRHENSKCKRKIALLRLLTLVKENRAFKNFRDFLRKHNNKE